jgi:dTDP-4-amino-4,6-dideoxygalactose transaminase
MNRIQISTPSMGEAEWEAVRGPIESGWLTQGPKVAEFEEAFATRHATGHALATTSCTSALHLMLEAAGIGPGDEVIVPSFTWVSTANAVIYAGATPVLADVDAETYNISVEDVARKVTEKTRGVIAVHLFGLCADIPGLRAALPDHIMIFEDAACAAGASLGGEPAGSLGHAAAFSFHPRKSITTGEGGMLTTNDPELASKAAKMRNHGAEISEEERHNGPQPYILPDFKLLGYNYRMTDLQGALGLVQLAKLDEFIAERNMWAQFFENEFSDMDWIQLPKRPDVGTHAWQSFVIRIVGPNASERRNQLMVHMEENGIATRPGTHAIHSLGYYSDLLNLTDEDLPGSATCRDTTMAIPLHNKMAPEDYQRVVYTLKSGNI